MFTRTFLKDTAERAIKTAAQALLAVLLVGTPLWQIAWGEALGIAATATVVSILTSVVSGGLGNRGTASMTSSVLPSPQEPSARLIEFSDLVSDRDGELGTDQDVSGRHRLDP